MLLYLLKPNTPLFSLFFLGFALGANIPSFSLSGILLRLYSGHRELRVLKTGYLNTLPVILGQSCPLSADLYGVFVHVNKIPFFFFLSFFPFRRYSGHGKKMITLTTLSVMLMFAQVRYSG